MKSFSASTPYVASMANCATPPFHCPKVWFARHITATGLISSGGLFCGVCAVEFAVVEGLNEIKFRAVLSISLQTNECIAIFGCATLEIAYKKNIPLVRTDIAHIYQTWTIAGFPEEHALAVWHIWSNKVS